MADLLMETDQDLRRLMRDPAYRMPGAIGDRLRALVRSGFEERYPGPVVQDATGRQTNVVVELEPMTAFEMEEVSM